MHRTFKTTSSRFQTYLDGYWDFITDPQDTGVDEGWYQTFPSKCQQVWVPGVWNTVRGYMNYEGVAWYRRRFDNLTCSALVVQFAAVTHLANVWLDGELLGEHYGGFLPFSFLVPQPECASHELVVRVDNTHDLTGTIPSARLDWFKYGGIPRPVWIDQIPGAGYISAYKLIPDVRGGRCHLQAALDLQNLSDTPLEDDLVIRLDGEVIQSEHLRINTGDTLVRRFERSLPNISQWSPEQPLLHQVEITFGGDSQIERVGFRHLEIDGSAILLNGQPLKLRGVHRHDDHPEWGFAVPEHLLLRDLELVQNLGLNALRTAHYPSDQRMLDLCDERGLMVIEEIPLADFSAEQLAIDIIADRASAMLWAMIQRDVSHPCIWSWSVMNECDTTAVEGYNVVEQLVTTAHEADPSRPVTFASRDALQDICFGLVDFVTVNAFFGWYSFDFTWPAFLDRVRNRIADKPLLVGEFGAEGLYGCRTLEENVMWSEEYQRQVVCDSAEYLLSRSDLVGFYIWQFCDSLADGGIHALTRPRSYNNKGLLDEYRRPKLVYYGLRDLLSGACAQQPRLL
ncbi:MAG: glycoside hydrolase family 2 protein [Anaerolineae bacterium]